MVLMLMLFAASSLCADDFVDDDIVIDHKGRLLSLLIHKYYEKDAEPPSRSDGVTNVSNVSFSLNLLCATPVGDLVSVEGYTVMVSSVDAGLTVLNTIKYKCKKLKQFKTPCKDDMVNSDN